MIGSNVSVAHVLKIMIDRSNKLNLEIKPDAIRMLFGRYTLASWFESSGIHLPVQYLVMSCLNNKNAELLIDFWRYYEVEIEDKHLTTPLSGTNFLMLSLYFSEQSSLLLEKVWHKIKKWPLERLMAPIPGEPADVATNLLLLLGVYSLLTDSATWPQIWASARQKLSVDMLRTRIKSHFDPYEYSILWLALKKNVDKKPGFAHLFKDILLLHPDLNLKQEEFNIKGNYQETMSVLVSNADLNPSLTSPAKKTGYAQLMPKLKNIVRANGKIDHLFPQYGLKYWLEETEGECPLAFLSNGWIKVMPVKVGLETTDYPAQRRLLSDWFNFFRSQLTLAHLQASLCIPRYLNQTPLMILASYAALIDATPWLQMWEDHGPSIPLTVLAQAAWDGSDAGKTPIYMLANAAANRRITPWQRFWQQHGLAFSVEHLRQQAQGGVTSQGKTTLWHLAAAVRNRAEGMGEIIIQLLPKLTLADLQVAGEVGTYRGITVLLNLMVAAPKGQLRIWQRLYECFGPKLTPEILLQKVPQGPNQGYNPLYFLIYLACKNKGECRDQLQALMDSYPKLVSDMDLEAKQTLPLSPRELFEKCPDDWGRKMLARIRKQRDLTEQTTELFDFIRKNGESRNFDVTPLLNRYDLSVWLNSKGPTTSLHALMMCAMSVDNLRPVALWWSQFFAQLTWQQVTARNMQKSHLLCFLCEFSVQLGSRFWQDCFNKFPAEQVLEVLRSETTDGTTLLWELANTFARSGNFDFETQVLDKFPNLRAEDLLWAPREGPNINEPVVLGLTAKTGSYLTLWPKVWKLIKNLITWDQLCQRTPNNSLLNAQPLLYCLFKMARENAAIWPDFWQTISEHLTVEKICEPLPVSPYDKRNDPATEAGLTLLWMSSQALNMNAALWKSLWRKFRAQLRFEHFLGTGGYSVNWQQTVLSNLIYGAHNHPEEFLEFIDQFLPNLTVKHFQATDYKPNLMWWLGQAATCNQVRPWDKAWGLFHDKLTEQDFINEPQDKPGFNLILMLTLMGSGDNNLNARQQLVFVIRKFPQLFNPDRLNFTREFPSILEILTKAPDTEWTNQLIYEIKAARIAAGFIPIRTAESAPALLRIKDALQKLLYTEPNDPITKKLFSLIPMAEWFMLKIENDFVFQYLIKQCLAQLNEQPFKKWWDFYKDQESFCYYAPILLPELSHIAQRFSERYWKEMWDQIHPNLTLNHLKNILDTMTEYSMINSLIALASEWQSKVAREKLAELLERWPNLFTAQEMDVPVKLFAMSTRKRLLACTDNWGKEFLKKIERNIALQAVDEAEQSLKNLQLEVKRPKKRG